MPVQMIKCRVMLALFIAAISFPSTAVAQIAPPKTPQSASQVNVRLHLVLKDDSPLIGAEVSVKGDRVERTSRSDSSGIVMVEGLAPGSIEIRVRRIGFKQTQFLARVATGDNAFTITVDETSVTLDEMAFSRKMHTELKCSTALRGSR